MNAFAGLGYIFDGKPAARYAELDDVRALRELTRANGTKIPAGTIGTVLLALGAGEAFEIAFGPEFVDLLTVSVEDIEAARGLGDSIRRDCRERRDGLSAVG